MQVDYLRLDTLEAKHEMQISIFLCKSFAGKGITAHVGKAIKTQDKGEVWPQPDPWGALEHGLMICTTEVFLPRDQDAGWAATLHRQPLISHQSGISHRQPQGEWRTE